MHTLELAADRLRTERARAVGFHPDGRLVMVATSDLLTFADGLIPDLGVARALNTVLGSVSGRLRAAVETFDGDSVTQDAITGCLGPLEKFAWLIRAHRLVGMP